MEKSLKFGAGIGNKCSGGWRSNTNQSRLLRLEKLQQLANPEKQASVAEY